MLIPSTLSACFGEGMESSKETFHDATKGFQYSDEGTEGNPNASPPTTNFYASERQAEPTEGTKIGAWMEQISHRLIKVERTNSKILTWLESSNNTCNQRNATGIKTGHGPASCPARTNAIRINLSDYEDLDDYSDEEDADVMMNVSSEDEDKVKRGKRKMKVPKNSPPKMKKRTRGRPRKDEQTNAKVKKNLERPTMDEKNKTSEEKSFGIVKKLFKSPSSSGTKRVNRVVSSQTDNNAQILESNKQVNATSWGKTTQENKEKPIKDDSTSRGKSHQKVVRTRFPLTAEMSLTTDEMQVATYIFGVDVDFSEVVFKIGVTRATIKDFECFCPRKPIEIDFVDHMARRITWRQIHINVQTVWALPPSFAVKFFTYHYEDVLGGLSKENIARLYVLEWMNSFTCLKYIYVPIKEDNGHVYLMVVSLEEQTIYHLDSSPDGAHMKDRRNNIKKLFSISYVNNPENIDMWDVKGITPPIEGSHGNDSALWVLQWMAMDFAFQPNVHGLMKENLVRIKTTMTLLLGSHNELRKNLEARAEVYYHTHMDTTMDK
ncbi:Ulp1 protease family, C-terminal catalytic domain [Sesbania bispinosa]|nr:Ulp1 protease family, C-terminal catalytic domain [Sesbania bispinosa]